MANEISCLPELGDAFYCFEIKITDAAFPTKGPNSRTQKLQLYHRIPIESFRRYSDEQIVHTIRRLLGEIDHTKKCIEND